MFRATSTATYREGRCRIEGDAHPHKLDASGKGTGDFFVLASPAMNEQVKFVSGDAEIKALAEIVKAADLGIVSRTRRPFAPCAVEP